MWNLQSCDEHAVIGRMVSKGTDFCAFFTMGGYFCERVALHIEMLYENESKGNVCVSFRLSFSSIFAPLQRASRAASNKGTGKVNCWMHARHDNVLPLQHSTTDAIQSRHRISNM